MRTVALFILLCFTSPACEGQPKKKKSKKPVVAETQLTGMIKFTQAWVWEYTDAGNGKKEMVIYHEPGLSYWLFTQEAYGDTDGMSYWILGKPDGEYLMAYQDAELNSSMKTEQFKIDFATNKSIPSYWKKGLNQKKFGDASLGFPLLTGYEYKLKYGKTNEESVAYIGKVKADMNPVYYFNRLNIDARLPIRFPTDLPAGCIILSEESKNSKPFTAYRLKYVSHTEYIIDLKAE